LGKAYGEQERKQQATTNNPFSFIHSTSIVKPAAAEFSSRSREREKPLCLLLLLFCYISWAAAEIFLINIQYYMYLLFILFQIKI
jgi:hypothetical protein